jgi:hypothetical protein
MVDLLGAVQLLFHGATPWIGAAHKYLLFCVLGKRLNRKQKSLLRKDEAQKAFN